jgi:hypothetical protein
MGITAYPTTETTLAMGKKHFGLSCRPLDEPSKLISTSPTKMP